MAKSETKQTEKEYVIPLRREWQKVARYKRTARSIKAIKNFIAKHMRVPDRDTSKVKLDMYLNNEVWMRGVKKPPARIKVKAVKKGDIVEVTLVEEPDRIKYSKARHDKRHAKAQKKLEARKEEKEDKEKLEEKVSDKEQSPEEKKAEKEKEKAVEQIHQKAAKRSAKADKHSVKTQKTQQTFRKALKK